MNIFNTTAEQYGTWLLTTMSGMPDGKEFDELQKRFDHLCDELEHLETCLRLPPYIKP